MEIEIIKSKLLLLEEQSLESEVIELKEAKSSYSTDKIGKYFSALSNEANLKGVNNAWLIFGLKNNGSICGTNYRNDFSSLDGLKKEIAQKTTNNITFINIHDILLKDKRVLLFEIPCAPKSIPIAWGRHYYGRNGEELSPLNIEKIDRIRKQQTFEDWSAKIVTKASIHDLDKTAIEYARQQFLNKNSKFTYDIDKWDDITFLNKAKLLIDGHITNTAILLLGKPESEYLLSPAIAKISWVLRDEKEIEKDYTHFTCPFILSVEEVFNKIRNLKYRYMRNTSIFPEEVDQYDPQNIREALNNCIAHQDYTLGSKITITEREDGFLTFSNRGKFIPITIENVINSDSPPNYYRNNLLSNAMVNLNMIDTIGSGIKRMFTNQSKKYFPLPDYNISNDRVVVTLTGKVLNLDFARALANNEDLSLNEIILLDKIQKGKGLNKEEANSLRRKGLIEGRRPNYHISSTVAKQTNQRATYILNRKQNDSHYKILILNFIEEYGSCTKKDIDDLILDKLPDILDIEQKRNKIKTLIQALSKRDKKIYNSGTNRKPIYKKKDADRS